ncbi:MAG: enoyl-CoA hydratase/isomerase family protein [Flavobacteriales bacterium]|nr:enoyl-CoA hydratase/isomerase family protein [Flavobacteriales bacterium]MCB9448464.1 enoyl-CoA hydratase/isomerase family protein [Flavobacteriales bacterium]
MKRIIKKVAVLGSGVMGSRIACHFANIGVEVLLLDIVPREPSEQEAKKGLTLKDPAVRNRIVNDALQFALKSNPSPIYRKSYASRIRTGNFEDDLKGIAECDWVIEVVVENLDIKKKVFDQVEKFRKPGTLITSNTSGIPIRLMLDGRSEDFQKHFCGTHFFNPPRYLRLLEIIPSPKTDPAVIDFLMHYGDRFLGKRTVLCKDTPAFIANRIGVYSIMDLFHTVQKMGLTVDEVDKLTGPVLGRPKSATFRTCDVVGLDTLVHVANGVRENCKDDEASATFAIPDFIQKMVDQKWLGSKTGQGFYKKVKGEGGKSDILSLNLQTLDYEPKGKVKFATLEAAKMVEDLRTRMKALAAGKDKAGEFYRNIFYGLFKYVSHRIPEISDELYKVDDAMNAGFGWELGPFELWDAVGVPKTVEAMKEAGVVPAPWVEKMLASGATSFYKIEGGVRMYYDVASASYLAIPGADQYIILDNLRKDKKVWGNPGATLFDIGDGILNLEFHSKMNTMGGEVIEGINRAIDTAEKDFRGLVIGNQGANFSAGANLAMIFMMAIEQEYDEIDFAIRTFQRTMMRVRYSSVPVVIAPHGLSLGGGCEIALHADRVQAAAETYTGLVEFGVGLIPGGGGTKEFALRASDAFPEGGDPLPILRERFLTIGMAKVSTSALEAFDLGIYVEGRDGVSVNIQRQIADAKAAAIEMAEAGYTQPVQRKDILVMGKSGLGVFYAGANSMQSGHYISEYDQFISQKLAYVICGGDLSQPTRVSEQYLLDLEREAFLSLTGEKRTLERIESMLKTGKPLRN